MPMKKQERKDSFSKIIKLMLNGENKQAFKELTCMCGTDTGLFIFVDYDETMKNLKFSKGHS